MKNRSPVRAVPAIYDPTVRARVLVADPPWSFRDSLGDRNRGAANHYPCMGIDELGAFPLPPLEPNCWLFLWRVAAMQAEALFVARRWGFGEPMSELVWVKTTNAGTRLRIGMGRIVRNAHEICLIFRRGRPERLDKGIPSVLHAPRGRHSEKPEIFYRAIEQLAPGPHVELSARRYRLGWTVYGNEV